MAVASKAKNEAIDEKTNKKKEIKKKDRAKRNLFASTKKFVKGTYYELKKVHWPNRREIIIYTLVVVTSVAVISILIGIFDLFLSSILNLIFG